MDLRTRKLSNCISERLQFAATRTGARDSEWRYVHDSIAGERTVLSWLTIFDDIVLADPNDLALKVQCRSGLFKIKARLLIDGENHRWTDYLEAKWSGALGEWPE